MCRLPSRSPSRNNSVEATRIGRLVSFFVAIVLVAVGREKQTMAKFAAILRYTTDAARLNEVRPSHRENLKALLDAGKLHESGPFGDGSGALIVYEAEDIAEAQTLLANDPFSKAGLITAASIREWTIVFGG